ncbi:hypothetical protein AAD001_15805 [Colwelliaceae bacterium 6471]
MKLKLIAASCCILFANSAFADPALVINQNGCGVADADGLTYWVAECEYKMIANNGHDNSFFQIMSGSVQLPDGAALPKKAFSYDAKDVGYSGCFIPGDESKWTVTPSGRVNFWCRVISD